MAIVHSPRPNKVGMTGIHYNESRGSEMVLGGRIILILPGLSYVWELIGHYCFPPTDADDAVSVGSLPGASCYFYYNTLLFWVITNIRHTSSLGYVWNRYGMKFLFPGNNNVLQKSLKLKESCKLFCKGAGSVLRFLLRLWGMWHCRGSVGKWPE